LWSTRGLVEMGLHKFGTCLEDCMYGFLGVKIYRQST
jgi:hypothetical protein